MDIISAKQELLQMVRCLKVDHEVWRLNMHRGCDSMRDIGRLNMKINKLRGSKAKNDDAKNTLIRQYSEQLLPLFRSMKLRLELMRTIVTHVHCMVNRVRLWYKDPRMVNHNITEKFSMHAFLSYLEFLVDCYDREFAVKEQVIAEMEYHKSDSAMNRLVRDWLCENFVGGGRFAFKLQMFQSLTDSAEFEVKNNA